MYYLIFDFDGVLGDTWNQRSIYFSKIKNITIEEAKQDGIEFFKYPHLKKGALSEEEVHESVVFIQETSRAYVEAGYMLFDGFIEEIAKLENAELAIVTNASYILLEEKIKQSKLHFSHIATIEDHHSKEEKILKICKKWNITIEQVYYFTDTQSDVLELENLLDKKKIIGCSWGYHGYDLLCEVLPKEQILRDFQDIHNIIH